MIVLFVSECERSAFQRSRRVLNRYAVQIGRRTWLARLSSEGLNDVRKALSTGASRNTAVACHRIRGRYQTELAWIVGSRKQFGKTGEFAFRSTSKPVLRDVRQRSPMERMLRYVVELAALLHDLGKHIRRFQIKIRDQSKCQSDPVRHERVSVQILLMYLESVRVTVAGGARGNTQDWIAESQWVAALTDQARLKAFLDQLWLAGHIKPLNREEFIVPKLSSPDERGRLPPVLSGLVALILTHHRLALGSREDGCDALEKSYVREEVELELATEFEPVWRTNGRWLERVASVSKRLQLALTEHGHEIQQVPAAWHSAVQFLARPALIIADHQVSAAKQMSTEPENLCYANSIPDGRGTLGQPLWRHLTEVASVASKAFRQLIRLQETLDLPSIYEAPYKLQEEIGPGPFFWQERAQTLITEHKSVRQGGFFGIVMAETGTGKTRGNARILSALSGHENLRWTVALGLRMLTLQTGSELADEIGLGAGSCVTMVGSSLSSVLFGQEEKQLSSAGSTHPSTESGSESTVLDDDLMEGIGGKFEDHFDPNISWPNELVFKSKPKLSLLLYAPVLVCTIDHIMPLLISNRASAAVLASRVISSDLVIDEFDSYQLEDILPIAKLVYLTAFFGRRVIISSATAPATICRVLYRAYSAGWKRGLAVRAENRELHVGWFTNFADCMQIKSITSSREFEKEHSNFVKSFINRMHKEPARRRLEVLDISSAMDAGVPLSSVYSTVVQHCNLMHQRHFSVDSNTGIRFSVGCVRWNNVRHTRKFAAYCLRQPPGSIKVVCYHAKHLALPLSQIEELLGKLLNGKHELRRRREVLAPFLGEAKRVGLTDLIIIVSTSPISEVGRDHDYDWAVLEPCSYWSLIQMAGRVWRHRQHLRPHDPNIALLSHPIKAIENVLIDQPNALPYCHPGPVSEHRRIFKDALDVRQCFDIASLNERIDASTTLSEIGDTKCERVDQVNYFRSMRSLEQYAFREVLESDDTMLSYWLRDNSPSAVFYASVPELDRFRHSDMLTLRCWKDPDENRFKARTARDAAVLAIEERSVRNDEEGLPLENSLLPEHAYEPLSLWEEWKERLAELGVYSPEIALGVNLNYYPGQPRFVHHTLLGFDLARASDNT